MPQFLLTIDVEDWFQVENFKSCIPYASWPSCELRVEKNVHTILDLLDGQRAKSREQRGEDRRVKGEGRRAEGKEQGAKSKEERVHEEDPASSPCSMPQALCCPDKGLKATFFILGWIAERLPHLVRAIDARGHEIASHGFHHRLSNQCTPAELLNDLKESRMLLEDQIGRPVYGYRAPSFSIDDEVLRVVKEAGYRYDSSYNSSALNSRHGKITLSPNGHRDFAHRLFGDFYELPISNLTWGGRVIPLGGGGYFRLIPQSLFVKGVNKILQKQGVCLFFFHPWEIDPDQPKVNNAPLSFRFRHYCNLGKTLGRLTNLIERFGDCRFETCYQYLEKHKGSV